ncbi:putative ankyrin repeat protein RF_0381 [Leptopilina heterotoma]|uniref:putative ankyrin repeat protein RF_0381 n=1 Tax=Leptopilina heterotoma TaxID=63436 RepID=UPI001CA860F9|nr:putative ankyrin repeat protein RF_0381 [Leptopilina heterotoma]
MMSNRKRTRSGTLKNTEDTATTEETMPSEETNDLIKRAKNSGKSPLILAITENKTQIVRELLDTKLKTYKRLNSPLTPLQYAAQFGNLEIIKLLFDNGFNEIELKKTNKESPLSYAVEHGNIDVIKYLSENGEKEKLSKQEKQVLIRKCIQNDRVDIVKCLVADKEGINEEDSNSETLLHFAASLGRVEILKYLIEIGADLYVKTDYNETPLHYAIRGQKVKAVEELLKLCEVKEEKYDTLFSDLAVHIAAEVGNEEIFRMLLAAGYSTESCFQSKNPIHRAAAFGQWKIIKILVDSGIDITKRTKNHETPLHFALTSGELSAVEYLLKSGVSLLKEKDDYHYPSPLENYLLDKEKWNSQFPLNLMIERQVKILRYVLNSFSQNQLNECLRSAIVSTLDPSAPEELLYVLLEYSNGNCKNVLSRYNCKKNSAIIIDHIEKVDILTKELNNTLEYSSFENTNYSEYKTFCQLIVARIALLLSISKNEKLSKHLSSLSTFSIANYYLLCKQQLTEMQSKKIHEDFDVTYYDILKKPIENIANYTKYEKMITSLESTYAHFSAYSGFFKTRIEKGRQRKELIDSTVHCLFNIVVKNHKIELPCLVIMEIFQSLSTIDLRKFIQACS